MSDHTTHGRGTETAGPDDPDCPCHETTAQEECSRSGCGFCRAQRQEDKARTFAPPPGMRREMVDGRFRLVGTPKPQHVLRDARQSAMPLNFGKPETNNERGVRVHQEIEKMLKENTKCVGGCELVDKTKLGPPVAHNPAFDLGVLLHAAYPNIAEWEKEIAKIADDEPRLETGRVAYDLPTSSMRDVYVPRPGYVQSSEDYSAAEVQAHAELSRRISESEDPRIDEGETEAYIAHGAGPGAPRRKRRGYCK